MVACGKPGFSHQRGIASDGDGLHFRNLVSTATITAAAGILLPSSTLSSVNAAETTTEIVFEKKEQSRRQCHSHTTPASADRPALAPCQCSEVRPVSPEAPSTVILLD